LVNAGRPRVFSQPSTILSGSPVFHRHKKQPRHNRLNIFGFAVGQVEEVEADVFVPGVPYGHLPAAQLDKLVSLLAQSEAKPPNTKQKCLSFPK
jgi:hypothetical protein